jgi:hypothetical protein
VQLPSGTTVVPHPGQGLSIHRRNADGSQIVVHAQPGRGLYGYKQTVDAAAGTRTRQYLDGSRIILGHDFVTRATPRGVSFTQHHNGLRDATAHDGRSLFTERFDGRDIDRTVYARRHHGGFVHLSAPVHERFRHTPCWGTSVYTYVPRYWAPAFFTPFFMPFGSALWWEPSPWVVWDTPVAGGYYSDPAYLLGDLQITGGFEDGYSDAMPTDGYDPGVAQLQSQVDQLQQEVGSEAAENDELRAQLQDDEVELNALEAQRLKAERAAVHVPDDVRAQIRSEVTEDLQLHEQQKPLELTDILSSPDALKYVFQVSEPLDVTDANTGESCSVSGGDLARLDALPAQNDPVAHLNVITSKPGSCRPGSVVTVSLAELQSMLNAFSQRLEQNVDAVHAKLGR